MVDQDIRIIIDATGSFAMLGKKNLPLYAMHAVRSLQQMQFLQQAEVSVYAWQGDCVDPASEEALMHPEGVGDIDALCESLSDGAEDGAVCLLLTDACFEQDDWQCLQGLPEQVRWSTIVVTLGADADTEQAEQCFPHVYALGDLPGALQAALLLEEKEEF